MASTLRHQDIDPETNKLATKIIGAAIEVHKALGPGFKESIYEEAFALQLTKDQIPFERQCEHNVYYLDKLVGTGRLDFFIDKRVVVELKAAAEITDVHMAQVISYLKLTNARVGFIFNFYVVSLSYGGIKRILRPSILK
ncbi:MAG: GxxExxY protein [Anaerolineae bacterium]|nr:GxxExxY protein [Anaerolineae bacterium]